MTIIWCIVLEVWIGIDLLVTLGHLLPFYIPNNSENQNFEKLEKSHGFIIILQMNITNDSHMMYGFLRYGVWQTEFFFILDHYLPRYPPNNPTINILKKLKKHLEISSFYTCVTKTMIICYTVFEIWRMAVHFGLFFTLLPA